MKLSDRVFASSTSKESFMSNIKDKFERASTIRTRYHRRRGLDTSPISLSFQDLGEQLLVSISMGDVQGDLTIPIPYLEQGTVLIGKRIKRAVGTWFLVDQYRGLPHGQEVNFWGLMEFLLIGRAEEHVFMRGISRKVQLDKLISSFDYETFPFVLSRVQKILNAFITKLPLCDVPMQAWAMNKRVIFVDPHFDDMSPEEQLSYQGEKNELFFPWSSIGLSDSSALKNYLLKADLRKYTPFGVFHHNPMRNLYQSLTMQGEERALVRTKSEESLFEIGVERLGYNLMTAFLDLPLTFEDQLILSTRLQNKVHTKTKTYVCFNHPNVHEEQLLNLGDVISVEPSGIAMQYQVRGDSARVSSIETRSVVFNGKPVTVWAVSVETSRTFKDGSKFTNRHGNKGVAVFMETGKMYDEGRKKYVDIDVIVSGKTISKRRNFGQILEALYTLTTSNEEATVISDNAKVSVDNLKARLVSRGYNEEGTSKAETPWGTFNTVCGWVFWGRIKDPEDAVWSNKNVFKRDLLGVRTSGIRLSPVELRAMLTIFGTNSAVLKEVLSYQEGADVAEELLRAVRSMRGELPEDVPVKSLKSFRAAIQKDSFFHTEEELKGTLSEKDRYKDGLIIELPLYFVTEIPKDTSDPPLEYVSYTRPDKPNYPGDIYVTNSLYVPFFELRAPWKHPTGLLGLSAIGGILNNLQIGFDELEKNPLDEKALGSCSRVIQSYFQHVAMRLTAKRGALAKYGMSVRYPNVTKATASVSDSLEKDHIQLPRELAQAIDVRGGEYVLIERFPCLGHESIRPQRVVISDNLKERYVVKVSANSLNSLQLDFDGDVLFIMSFKTAGANEELERAWRYPNKYVRETVDKYREAYAPITEELTLSKTIKGSINNGEAPLVYRPLTPQVSAILAKTLIGLKAHTGTSIALGYNIMRIIESSQGFSNRELLAESERILSAIASSVFSTKHQAAKVLEN